MNKVTSAIKDMISMDELSKGSSFIHVRDPLLKLIVTIAYLTAVISYDTCNLTGLIPILLIPVITFILSGIEIRICFYKLRIILPLVLFIGIWNPILNRRPAVSLGNLLITEGMISLFSLMIKAILSLMMTFILVATTGIDGICLALRRLHVPGIIVSLILITYRYMGLLLEEADTLWTAYTLRAPGQKGVRISAWGTFLGQLLIRTMDRSLEIYAGMTLRGYNGDFAYVNKGKTGATDIVVSLIYLLVIIAMRFINISEFIGGLIV